MKELKKRNDKFIIRDMKHKEHDVSVFNSSSDGTATFASAISKRM